MKQIQRTFSGWVALPENTFPSVAKATAILLIACVLLGSGGCATTSFEESQRQAFYPIQEKLLTAQLAGEPIARNFSFYVTGGGKGFLTEQELQASGGRFVTHFRATDIDLPPTEGLTPDQADKAIRNAITNSPTAIPILENQQFAQFEHTIGAQSASLYIPTAEVNMAGQQMMASAGLLVASAQLAAATMSAAKNIDKRKKLRITKNIVNDMHLLGPEAPTGSHLHIRFHTGSDDAGLGTVFKAGIGAMFGSSIRFSLDHMVTATLKLANGNYISASRAFKVHTYAGKGLLSEPFPEGYKEISPSDFPQFSAELDPEGTLKDYSYFAALARAAANDVRLEYLRR